MIQVGSGVNLWSKNLLGGRFGHVVQTWLQGTTTVPIEIGKKGWYLKKLVKVERWSEPGS